VSSSPAAGEESLNYAYLSIRDTAGENKAVRQNNTSMLLIYRNKNKNGKC